MLSTSRWQGSGVQLCAVSQKGRAGGHTDLACSPQAQQHRVSLAPHVEQPPAAMLAALPLQPHRSSIRLAAIRPSSQVKGRALVLFTLGGYLVLLEHPVALAAWEGVQGGMQTRHQVLRTQVQYLHNAKHCMGNATRQPKPAMPASHSFTWASNHQNEVTQHYNSAP